MADLLSPIERYTAGIPDRILAFVPGMTETDARYLAQDALARARLGMPRVTGRMANSLRPDYGPGYFGIAFPDQATWFQEQGTKPFTMNSLAGKTIPMWVDDPTGAERAKNPSAKVRATQDGRTQVLIFRKAALHGQRKTAQRRNKRTGKMHTRSVPRSYPGAPGRIARREAPAPFTQPGRVAGAITGGNVGVRWRHPGLKALQFLNGGVTTAAFEVGLSLPRVYMLDGASFEQLRETPMYASDDISEGGQ